MTVGTLPKLTPHQRWALLHLERHAPARLDGERWASVKDTGSPTAMEHLVRKGYAERRNETGPRGGELRYYRPTARGYEMAAHIRVNGLKTFR